jgi:hypothetical protein
MASRPSTSRSPIPHPATPLTPQTCHRYSGYYDGGITGQAVMFLRSGLENTTHTVVITNLGDKPRNLWGLDYVVVNYTVPGVEGESQASSDAAAMAQTGATSSSVATSTGTTSRTTSSASSNSAVAVAATPKASQTSGTSSSLPSSAATASTDGAVVGGSNLEASRSDKG